MQDFNSHTREGVTSRAIINFAVAQNFNSHTREGVTYKKISPLLFGNFNSHTREGVTTAESK